MAALFTPFSLNALRLPNRIVVSPMCQYSAVDGSATDWHLMHLGQLALSGAGLLFIEATSVEPEGRITHADLGLWSDENERALSRVLDSVRRYSPIPVAIQLAHAGRKASNQLPWEGGQSLRPEQGGWRPVAPSPLPFHPENLSPTALDAAGMARVRDAFVAAARRADRLGIEVIEIHSAHGYLLHEFLSPLSNQRDDDYGGALENRLRFPLEVFDAVRAVIPAHKPVGVRISATDWFEGGWDVDQSIAYVQALKARGLSFVDVSSGALTPQQKIEPGPGFQIPFAERIRAETQVPTIGVGLITEAEQAEAVIAKGQADLVALGRTLLFNPRWPWHAAAQLGEQVYAPPQYWRAPTAPKASPFNHQLPASGSKPSAALE